MFKRTRLSVIIGLIFIISTSTASNAMSVDPNYEIIVFQTTWEEMFPVVKSNLATLITYDSFPENATTWEDYAERCFEDLLSTDECWFASPATGVTGFRPYVKGADGWGVGTWERDITELMAEMDVLWPMYRYLEIHPNSTRQTIDGEG